MFFMSALGKASEFQHDFSDITDGRLTEYLQSAFVSSENKYAIENKQVDQSKKFYKIKNLFGKIYADIHIYYMFNAFILKEAYSDLDDTVVDNIVEAQLLYGKG